MDLRSCTLLSSHRSPLDKTTAPSISVFRCYSRLFPDDSELPQVFCHVDRVNALAIPSPSACGCRRWILAVPILLDSLCVRLGQAGVLLTLLLSNRLIRGRISHHAKRPTDYIGSAASKYDAFSTWRASVYDWLSGRSVGVGICSDTYSCQLTCWAATTTQHDAAWCHYFMMLSCRTGAATLWRHGDGSWWGTFSAFRPTSQYVVMLKGRALVIAPQVDTTTAEALRYMARTKQRRTYLPCTFPAVGRCNNHKRGEGGRVLFAMSMNTIHKRIQTMDGRLAERNNHLW